MPKDSLSGVKKEDVARVVNSYLDDGAAHITIVKDADGTYTVSASG